MRRENQQGMASIVVVSVLIVIMTLISIGFARMMNRAAIDAANKQFSASATYAAESGINDVAAYLKQYAQANPGLSYLPKSTKCNGANSLIGSSSSPGPFYTDSNLANDSTHSTQYTCILLNPTPASLVYGQVQNIKSQVVKVNTSASAGALEKMMISWQPSCDPATLPNCPAGYPTSSSNLSDETTWNTATAACRDSTPANSPCLPLLRLSIYPVTNGEALTSAQGASKTVFLYPQASAGNVPVQSFASFKDGSIVPVGCTQSVGATDFNPSTTAPYKCNIIISALSSALSPASTDSVYLRLTPIYNQANIEIQANDKYGNNLDFINDQAVIDVTAQTAGVAKRLQARVDTSSLVNGATGVDTNISSGNNVIPEQALRTAVSLCKREVQTTTAIGFSSYVNFDDPDGVCHDLNGTTSTTNPVPTLTFTIKGLNGTDNGRTVDSEANNPDSPQSPVQKGTVYVGSSPGSNDGAGHISWTTADATVCTATNGSSGWAGNKSITPLTGNPPTNGSGSQDIGSISTVTTYSMQCDRPPYRPAPTPVKNVTIWPYPLVWFSQTSLSAGSGYSLTWNVENSTSCTASGSWSGSKSSSASLRSFSEGQGTWQWYDTSAKTYTITCSDPIGRTSTASITLGPNQSNNCGGGSSCSGNVSPPSCSGNINPNAIEFNGGGFQWSVTCPDVSPSNGGYHYDITGPSTQSGDGYGASSGIWWSPQGGHYCLDFTAWVPGWGSSSSPNWSQTVCQDIYTIHVNNFQALVWDEGPNECNATSGAQGQWLCRNNPSVINTANGCPDGVHRWHACAGDIHYSWYFDNGLSGNYSCSVSANTYGGFWTVSGNANNGNPATGTGEGWVNSGPPYPFSVTCTGPTGSASASWNG